MSEEIEGEETLEVDEGRKDSLTFNFASYIVILDSV